VESLWGSCIQNSVHLRRRTDKDVDKLKGKIVEEGVLTVRFLEVISPSEYNREKGKKLTPSGNLQLDPTTTQTTTNPTGKGYHHSNTGTGTV